MPIREKPGCPRCGYDLSGMLPTWTERCPLEGVCSECGLEYRWAGVFDELGLAPRWQVESHRAVLFPLSVFTTLAMLLRPIRFWSSVPTLLPFKPLRVGAVVLGVFLLTPLVNLVMYAIYLASGPMPLNWVQSTILMEVGPLFQYILELMWFLPRYEHHEFVLLTVWVLLTPISVYVICLTKRHEWIRLSHIARAWMYSIAIVLTAPFYAVTRNVLSEVFGVSSYPSSSHPYWVRAILSEPLEFTRPYVYGLYVVWFSVFYWGFFARHLKVEHPLSFTVSFILISSAIGIWVSESVPILLTW